MSFCFCPECGTRYAELASPRVCQACGAIHYFNALPVAVLLVEDEAASGFLAVERNEKSGPRMALPGGFVMLGESWQDGGVREVREETGILVDPGSVVLQEAVSTPNGNTILMFGRGRMIGRDPGPTDGEVLSHRFVPWADGSAMADQFRFPLHAAALRRYLLARAA